MNINLLPLSCAVVTSQDSGKSLQEEGEGMLEAEIMEEYFEISSEQL